MMENIVPIIIGLLVVIVILRSVKVVPQQSAYVVQHPGRKSEFM